MACEPSHYLHQCWLVCGLITGRCNITIHSAVVKELNTHCAHIGSVWLVPHSHLAIKVLRPGQNGCCFAGEIFKCIQWIERHSINRGLVGLSIKPHNESDEFSDHIFSDWKLIWQVCFVCIITAAVVNLAWEKYMNNCAWGSLAQEC